MSADAVPEPTPQTDPKSTPKLEPLQLPKGALIAFRVREAARTRELVVYPDGRVSFGGPDVSKEAYARVPRQLNDAQIARLRKTLARANFFRLESAPNEPTADACAYDLAARAGNRVHTLTVSESALPDALKPLIEQLRALMPKE